MEDFKIEIFQKENSGKTFPEYRALLTGEMEELYQRILTNFKIARAERESAFLQLFKTAFKTEFLNAEDNSFSLVELLSNYNIQPLKSIFIDWYMFNKIDCMLLEDVDKNFFYIWYPGPDDITIFDETLSWLLFVTHEGDTYITKLTE